jgi:hypothetical protein
MFVCVEMPPKQGADQDDAWQKNEKVAMVYEANEGRPKSVKYFFDREGPEDS